jgi:hypothetical protein
MDIPSKIYTALPEDDYKKASVSLPVKHGKHGLRF